MQMPSGKTWYVGGTLRRPLCLGQSERREEREEGKARRGWGQVMQDLVGHGEDLGFDPPREMRALEGYGQRRGVA